ncbi:MAG: hypothetical protein WC725_00345 [Patescibacteria group bacterium]
MLYPVKLYVKDRWVSVSLAISAAFFVYILWYTFVRIKPTTDQLFLHYNIIFGIDLIGEWWKLYSLPLLSFTIVMVNFITSYVFHRTNRFLSRFLVVITAFLELLLVVAVNLIVGLNS